MLEDLRGLQISGVNFLALPPLISACDSVDIHATEVGDIHIPLSDLQQDYEDEVEDEDETVKNKEEEHKEADTKIKSQRGKGKINLFKERRRNKKNLRKRNRDYSKL